MRTRIDCASGAAVRIWKEARIAAAL